MPSPAPDRRRALRRLLDAHFPADERESDYLESLLALLEIPGDPFDRGTFTPGHFTASAFVVSPDGGALLLIHHAKLGRWLQPGGHFEPDDDDLFAAAAREVREETGLAGFAAATPGALFDVDVHDIPARKKDPDHRHYDLRVLFRATTTEVAAGDGVTGAKWVPLPEVAAAGTDESVLRAVRKLQAG
jgi:8-oxo-dGTP pyrophosphatase MutT (NUDIX family)